MRRDLSCERRVLARDVGDHVSRFIPLPQRRQEIAECIRVACTVPGCHHVKRIFAAVEKTDVRRRVGQEWAIPLQCKSLLGHITLSRFRSSTAERSEEPCPSL
jgi:hypothetical protein